MDPVPVSSRALPPAEAPREPAPYVSPPSFRGVVYHGPVGYRHHDNRPWLFSSRGVLWTLALAAGLVLYARSEQWLPLVKGHSTTRVLSGSQPRPPKDPFAGDAQWSTQARHTPALPSDLSRLPATGAGVVVIPDQAASAYKCVLPDGTTEYRQQACDAPLSPLRPRRH